MHIAEAARYAQIEVVRDAAFIDLALIGPAAAGALVYVVDERSLSRLDGSSVGCVLTTPALADRVPEGIGLATSAQPERDFYAIHSRLLAETDFYWLDFPSEIDPSAVVHERAYVAPRGVRIGPRTVVEPNAVIHERVSVGEDSIIRAGSVIGAEGFEFKGPAMRQGRASRADRDYGERNERVPHAGSVEIGARVEIQALCGVDRSVFRAPTVIGDDTKLDNLVHVAHNARIGRNCLITAGAIIAGSAMLGDEVWIGPGSVISSGVTIGDRAAIVIGSTITKDVAADVRVSGDLRTYRLT